ncbi:MAG: Rrf2 family transcriptional regulator [Bacteroidota bacterium]|nr:Rrf2 family transcriptional regulator [Bacteroidota bacterium]
MSVLFSRPCEYALQAVLYLAQKREGEMTSAKELTSKLDIPYHFISKILQDLTYKKLLYSQTGPTGGFALAKSPKKILFLDIVEAIDGKDYKTNCVMGFSECGGEKVCAVHDKWKLIKENIHNMLVSKNIFEMAKEMNR